MKTARLLNRFNFLRTEKRGGLVTFVTAGDPERDISSALIKQLPKAGADIIEIGMPFSDPMADGPVIQASSQRALAAGMNLKQTLEIVNEFRSGDIDTPIILMGYFNPIYQYGPERFVNDAITVGVDRLIIVDLPPEEDDELCHPSLTAGLHWIRLVTPTTDVDRIQTVLKHSSGFVYYVSITGITGTRSADYAELDTAIKVVKDSTDIPIAIGFGIQTPDQVRQIVRHADAAVVGSALIREIERTLKMGGNTSTSIIDPVLRKVKELSAALTTKQL